MKVIFAALFVGLSVIISAFGQEKAAEIGHPFVADSNNNAPKNISVQLEYIEMSHKDLTRLLMEHKPTSSDATALRMKVQEMVEKDLAKVIESQMVVGKAGRKSMTTSKHESIYPSEYQPQTLPDKAVDQTDESKAIPVTCTLPAAFETRNVGSQLEVESHFGDNNKILDVRIVSQFIWQTENTIWHEGKDPVGNDFKVAMPNFYLVEIDTNVTTFTGQYFLAGVVSPKDAKGHVDSERKVMAFLKCDALSVVP